MASVNHTGLPHDQRYSHHSDCLLDVLVRLGDAAEQGRASIVDAALAHEPPRALQREEHAEGDRDVSGCLMVRTGPFMAGDRP
jgi:hypothetical protein